VKFDKSPSVFRPLAFLQCVFDKGHEWTNSKAKKGFMTCRRCRIRRRWRGV